MLAVGILCLFLLVATVTDILWQKIFNWTTYSGTLVAWILNLGGTLAVRFGWATVGELEAWGYIGLGRSLIGFVACGLILLVCYVIFDIGGGDVKLLAMMGAYLGPERGIEALLWTLVLGGCLALIIAIWQVGVWQLIFGTGRAIWTWLRWRHWTGIVPEEKVRAQRALFLAPCALLAVLVVAGPLGL
jgi:prepilin peptidase CpaA